MKNKAETTQAPKVRPAKAQKGKRNGTAKAAEDNKADSEPVDRLPANLDELKETKGGLVSFLFLSGKGSDDIAKELKAAFKLPDAQAVRIVRRITGRTRFFRRVFQLMAAK